MIRLTNAPYMFSNLIAKVLRNLPNKFAKWYVNDILIPIGNFDELLQHLELIHKALLDAV